MAEKTVTPNPAASAPAPAAGATTPPAEGAPAPEVKQDAPQGQPAAPDVNGQGELALKLPEGVKDDSPDVQSVLGFAKQHKLSQEQAQALFDSSAASAKQAEADWAQQLKTWEAETRADPEIGGKNFDKSKANVQRVMARFDADKKLEAILNKTGFGLHKDVFRVLAKIGEATMGEDRIDPKAKGNALSAEDQLQQMYDKSPEMFKPRG